jgi:hypothetical protein
LGTERAAGGSTGNRIAFGRELYVTNLVTPAGITRAVGVVTIRICATKLKANRAALGINAAISRSAVVGGGASIPDDLQRARRLGRRHCSRKGKIAGKDAFRAEGALVVAIVASRVATWVADTCVARIASRDSRQAGARVDTVVRTAVVSTFAPATPVSPYPTVPAFGPACSTVRRWRHAKAALADEVIGARLLPLRRVAPEAAARDLRPKAVAAGERDDRQQRGPNGQVPHRGQG